MGLPSHYPPLELPEMPVRTSWPLSQQTARRNAKRAALEARARRLEREDVERFLQARAQERSNIVQPTRAGARVG